MSRTKTDPTVLSARRRLRDSIRRENDMVESRMRDSARRDLYSRRNDDQYVKRIKEQNSIVHATIKMASVVAHSMDVHVPITASVSNDSSAMGLTNFKSITIHINPDVYDLNDYKQVARLLKFTKGVLYHEIGHCKFSTPLADLAVIAGVDIGGIPNKQKVAKAWNLLEDQRMECAMVRYSPIMMNYFTVIVLDHVVKVPEMAWPFVAGRTYLPKPLLDKFKTASNDYAKNVLYDPTLTRDTSRVVSEYKRAKNATDMFTAVMKMVDIVERWTKAGMSLPEGTDKHQGHFSPGGGETVEQIKERIKSSSHEDDNVKDNNDASEGDGNEQTDNTEQDGSEGNEGGETGFDKEDNQSFNDSQSSNQNNDEELSNDTYTPGDGVSEHEEPGKTLSDLVKEAREEAFEATKQDEQDAKDFMTTVNEERERSLPHTTAVKLMEGKQLDDAADIANNMLSVLEPLATQVEPSWRFRQETGILDPVSYLTREPGDTDFWTDLDDEGRQGYDVAVSVLLDVSYSMGNACYDLGSVALGIRKACDELELPCTVSVFDDNHNMLWAADEEPTEMWAYANGGTNPYGNLQDLDNQMHGKSRHLVVILTDGVWPNDCKDLSAFSRPGRYIICVGYDAHNPSGLREALADLNPNEAFGIRNVREFPSVVTSAISAYFA